MRDREGIAGETGGQRISGIRVICLNEPTDRWKDTKSGKKPVGLDGSEHANLSKKVLRVGMQL